MLHLQPRSDQSCIIQRMKEAPTQPDDRVSSSQEQSWISAARKGCGASARLLVEAHQDRLFAFVWRMVRHKDDAEELCQETFLRAFSALHSFDAKFRFSTWLFTIAYRLTLNQIRRRRDFSGDVDFGGVAERDADGNSPAGVCDELADGEAAAQLQSTIWSAVDELSGVQKAAVLLFYRESMNCQDIGEVLNIPAATVKSHLHRARARLKDALSERVGDSWGDVRLGALETSTCI